MRTKVASIVFVLLCGTLATCTTNLGLNCIGKSGIKTFCADTTQWRTWEEAKSFCESKGWNLASIQTIEETEELLSAFDSNLFSGDYWTSGRDIQAHEQFVWDFHNSANSGQLNINFNTFVIPKVPLSYQTCLVYSSLPDRKSGLGIWSCAKKLATLCEKL